MVKISIITINFNNLSGLKLTIDSVMGQIPQNFEYIIIDGGSTDGSAAYIKQHQDSIDHWISEQDRGVYHAMNKGISAATGDYVLFLNSGDHFLNKHCLEEALAHLGQHDIVYFDLSVEEKEKSIIKTYPDALSFSFFAMDTLPHPATFIRRTAFAKAGIYREDLSIVSDWKFFMDGVCKYDFTYQHVAKVLSVFYIGGMSSTPANYRKKMEERKQELEKDYKVYFKDIKDTIELKKQIETLRTSKIIGRLVRLGFLNKF